MLKATKIILILLVLAISAVNTNIIFDLFSKPDNLTAHTEMFQVAFGEEYGNSNSNSNANHNGSLATSRTPTKNSDKMKVIVSE